VRTTSIQTLAGIAVPIGALFAARTFNLNKEGQFTDRFVKAVECLGNTELHVRIGAIYALERLARDSERDHTAIMEILCTYVRGGRIGPLADRYPPDLQAALTVIGRRLAQQDSLEFRVNLEGADLTGAVLARANLDQASFVRTTLRGAVLAESQLNGARFVEPEMEGVSLIGASLRSAKLGGAKLQRSALTRLTLQTQTSTRPVLAVPRFRRSHQPGMHMSYVQ
jgi:Pentapeptide repeats (8 copies)